MVRLFKKLFLFSLLSCTISSQLAGQIRKQDLEPAVQSISEYLSPKAHVVGQIKIESIQTGESEIRIRFNRALSEYPLRDADLKVIYDCLRRSLPERYRSVSIKVTSSKSTLEELSSNFYSGKNQIYRYGRKKSPWISRRTDEFTAPRGLSGRNIALWPSHGYYYNKEEERWKWQRAPFFTTIEDLYSQSIIVPFLAPMLENAGAYVVMPRERDFQLHEILVDNGSPSYSEKNGGNRMEIQWKDTPGPGFADPGIIWTSGINPFRAGTARMATVSEKNPATASYQPEFPETGEYAVYVSYASAPNSTSAAQYLIRHAGGESRITVNQKMGGGTWVYLGSYRFSEGQHQQGVTVSGIANSNTPGEIISTDAVRFGGGMGNIARDSVLSGVPRYAEGSRYWLQWSGFPESVYNLNEDKNDYNDDFRSRGEWVNSLTKDFSVPVDAAFALHTDAGFSYTDSTVGTLAIYTRRSENRDTYSDGAPRLLAREMADIIQTQIVSDLRKTFDASWSRRGLRDRSYYESRVPETPTILIELLAHQNFADMKHGLDPTFRFTVARAIYKGMLRFLSSAYGFEYTVQPLPVQDFSAMLSPEGKAEVTLSWKPTADPLEKTATPDSYIVYTRISEPGEHYQLSGFDNGTKVEGTQVTLPVKPGKVYSYKVVAVNKGGISFPSEILSAGYVKGGERMLIVNNFTRTSGPENFDYRDTTTAGFHLTSDSGVPYIQDHSYVGRQYNFTRIEDWKHDDNPGFGASYLDYGLQAVAGNTFDYPAIHGNAIIRSGMSFSSCSASSILSGKVTTAGFKSLDIIVGKEKKNILPIRLQHIISNFCYNGGNILISGAYIGKHTVPEAPVTESRGLEMLKEIVYDLNLLKTDIDSLLAETTTLRKNRTDLNNELGYNYFNTEKAEFRKFDERLSRQGTLIDSIARNTQALEKGMKKILSETDLHALSGKFAAEVLKFKWSNDHASSRGQVLSACLNDSKPISFSVSPNPRTYCVESVDALLPADKKAFTFMRYAGSNTSAAVAYSGSDYKSVVFGFPLETITSQQQIDEILCEVLRFFKSGKWN